MSSFTDSLYVRKISARTWEVTRAFEYHVGKEGSGEVITVLEGFITDFASVPRFLWVLFPPDGKYTQAAVLHDRLYANPLYTRKKSDYIFYEAMGVLGVPKWKKWIMWKFVHAFSWMYWKK